MSGEEDFLKRWSRRKRQAAEAEEPAEPEANAEASAPAAAEGDAAGEPRAENPAVEFDPASLPPIESINALSDVTAFLRAGVPAELTRAALRRVWTADPAICEFIGLAENSWDFTDPAAMPGFGPLEASEEVRRMIAQVVDQISQAAKPVSAPVPTEAPDGDAGAVENSNDSKMLIAGTRDEGSPEAAPPPQALQPDNAKESSAHILGAQVLLHGDKENVASQHELIEAQEKPKQKQMVRRGHGRALPQ